MSENKLVYGTTSSITITLASLANSSAAVSSTVDNTTDLFYDVLIELVVNHTAAPSATGYLDISIKGSIDNTDFDDDNNAKWVGSLVMTTTSTGTRKRVISVASAFSGAMPPYWQVRVLNVSGAALATTGSSMQYRGLKSQSV